MDNGHDHGSFFESSVEGDLRGLRVQTQQEKYHCEHPQWWISGVSTMGISSMMMMEATSATSNEDRLTRQTGDL